MQFIILQMIDSILCNYCQGKAALVGGKEIYPHRPDLYGKYFYLCRPCDAYVGCHPETKNALGRVANFELRRAKNRAHAAFDPIWKSGRMKRGQAYLWLSESLGIHKSECHIGMFDVDMCKKVAEVCRD